MVFEAPEVPKEQPLPALPLSSLVVTLMNCEAVKN
jgi:hypothetical protein